MDLPAVTQSLIWTELGRTFVPFRFGGEADNILYLADERQRAAYPLPTIAGDRISCFAITEPAAGSDAANIRLRARPDGDDWVLSGEKTFITNGNDADFARRDRRSPVRRSRGPSPGRCAGSRRGPGRRRRPARTPGGRRPPVAG